jgi:diguanylate cyclase (GGDEF)-like protein
LDPIARLLSDYLRDVRYNPQQATLDLVKLPEGFRDFGRGLQYFAESVFQTTALAKALAKGDLNIELPPYTNEMAAPLIALHASMKHLEQRRTALMEEIEHLHKLKKAADSDTLTQVYNRRYGMEILNEWLTENKSFIVCFVDIDNLKYVNDEFGHTEGDKYILSVADTLRGFSAKAIICRLGGDEFMLLAQDWRKKAAVAKMEALRSLLANYSDQEALYTNSISYGIVEVGAGNTMIASELLSIADEKMYEYKRAHKAQHRQGNNFALK